MAGLSTKNIKQRIRSMESTRQITRAMEMVAASKLRRAQDRIQDSRPYFEILYRTIAHIAGTGPDFSSPISPPVGTENLLYRNCGRPGLAGGYNNNVFQLVQKSWTAKSSAFCQSESGLSSISAAVVFPFSPIPMPRPPRYRLETVSPCRSSWPRPTWLMNLTKFVLPILISSPFYLKPQLFYLYSPWH